MSLEPAGVEAGAGLVPSSDRRLAGGSTMPAEITSFMPSSTEIGSRCTSLSGRNRRNPEVIERAPGEETDGPDAAARILQQHDLAKGHGLVADHRVDDLLGRAVDAAHDRHAIEQTIAEPQQHFADVTRSNGADQRQDQDHQHDADAGDGEREVGLGIVDRRDQVEDPLIDEGNQQKGDIDGDRDGRRHQHAGEEVPAQPRPEPNPHRLCRGMGRDVTWIGHGGMIGEGRPP